MTFGAWHYQSRSQDLLGFVLFKIFLKIYRLERLMDQLKSVFVSGILFDAFCMLRYFILRKNILIVSYLRISSMLAFQKRDAFLYICNVKNEK